MNKPGSDTPAPFGPELPPGGLYCGVVLQQRLDLIEHLLEFGRQLILLSGVPGSGKTTLLRNIVENAGDRWRCIYLNAGPMLNAHALLTQTSAALDLDEIHLDSDEPPATDGDLREKLCERITALERNGTTVILVIDDADQLLIETVGALLSLARTEEPLSEARVLMSAGTDHSALLAALQRDHPQHGLVHVVEIPLLSDEQVEAFLRQRFGAVGEVLEDWFSPNEVTGLATEAQGNPGSLIALARQAMAGRERRMSVEPRLSARTERSGGGAGMGLGKVPALKGAWRWAPLLLLPLAAAGWFLFGGRPPAQPELAPVTPPPAATVAEPAAVPPMETKVTTLEGDRQRIEITLPPQGSPSAVAAVPAPSTEAIPAPAEPTVETGAPVPLTTPAAAGATAAPEPAAAKSAASEAPALAALQASKVAEAAPAAASKPAPRPITQPATPKPGVKATPKPTAPASRPKLASSSPASVKPAAGKPASSSPMPTPRPAAAPSTGYALQLFGVSTRAAATGFIGRHGLGSSARIIDTRRNGKPWFIVTYGQYATRTTAQNAAARLPPAVQREVEPWVRDVKSLNALPR